MKDAINQRQKNGTTPAKTHPEIATKQKSNDAKAGNVPKEVGGRPKDKGLEPTRYGDWELKGRCIDF